MKKDEVKRLGAYWNHEQRQWYVPAGYDLTPFARWLPDSAPSTNKIARFSLWLNLGNPPAVSSLVDTRFALA